MHYLRNMNRPTDITAADATRYATTLKNPDKFRIAIAVERFMQGVPDVIAEAAIARGIEAVRQWKAATV